jgi:predicted metal-dependent hydrolase
VMAHILDNGKVEVHMPFDVPNQAAEDVVNKFLPDIEKQITMRKQTAETKKNINYSFQPLLFGERYPIIKSNDDFCGFSPTEKCFYLIPGLRQYQIKNFLKNFYTKIGHSVFSKRMKELSEYMGIKYRWFQISQAASPFGRCVEQGELIELSWALVMTDDDVWDSVSVHELAHIKYDDHYSTEFKALFHSSCSFFEFLHNRGRTLLQTLQTPANNGRHILCAPVREQ